MRVVSSLRLPPPPSPQDIYLLRYDGPVSELKFDPSEVEDVKLMSMDQLKKAFSEQV